MPIDYGNFSSKQSSGQPFDPHGQAALLLVESLIHVLRERSIITTGEAIEVVTTALDVQADYAEAADGSEETRQSYALLSGIAESLQLDLRGPEGVMRANDP
jgi:hypothetical protein